MENINWDEMDKTIDDVKNTISETDGGDGNKTEDSVKIVYFNPKSEKTTETITGRMISLKSSIVYSVGFHYETRQFMQDQNSKCVCNNNVTDFNIDKYGMCGICDGLQSKRVQEYELLSNSVFSKDLFEKDGFDQSNKGKLYDFKNSLWRMKPRVFYYLPIIPLPYSNEIMLVRLINTTAFKVLTAIKENRMSLGSDMFNIENGYDVILHFKNGGNGYLNLDKVVLSGVKNPVTRDDSAYKELVEFLEKVDVYERMRLDFISTEDGRTLLNEWVKLMDAHIEKCGVYMDEESGEWEVSKRSANMSGLVGNVSENIESVMDDLDNLEELSLEGLDGEKNDSSEESSGMDDIFDGDEIKF